MTWHKDSEEHRLAAKRIATKLGKYIPDIDEYEGAILDAELETSAEIQRLRESTDAKDIKSPEANELWTKFNNYMFFSDDPQFNKLVWFRKRINALEHSLDRQIMINIFNEEIGNCAYSQPDRYKAAWDYYQEYE